MPHVETSPETRAVRRERQRRAATARHAVRQQQASNGVAHWGWRLGLASAAVTTLLAATTPMAEPLRASELPAPLRATALTQPLPPGYIVEPGDTLSDIAMTYNLTIDDLARWNSLHDPDFISVGQLLQLTGTRPTTRPAPLSSPAGYTVEPGDTLSGVAIRFDVPVASLVAWNNLADPDRIIAGAKLRVADVKPAAPGASFASAGAEWMGSPNFWPGRPSGQPIALVVHTMAGSLEGARGEFANPFSNASAHYGIGLGGTVHQYVDLADRAWANGGLEPGNIWPGPAWMSPNELTVSIETEDLGDLDQPVTEAQYQATLRISRQILGRYPSIQYVTTHRAISPQTRPNDPGDRWVAKGRLAALANALGLKLLP